MTRLPRNTSQEQRMQLYYNRYSTPTPVRCTMCKEKRPEVFYYDLNGSRSSMCRKCINTRQREHKTTVREEREKARQQEILNETDEQKKQRIYSQRWKEKNPDHYHTHTRPRTFLQKYGLTEDEYQKMLKSQSGLCAICGKLPENKRGLNIDHCHQTGKVRGLLCMKCNMMLGHASDNIETLKRGIDYLNFHNQ